MERKFQMFQPEKPLAINVIIINSTKLNIGDSKLSFLDSFHHEDNAPDRSSLGILVNANASQNAPNAPAPASSAGLQSHQGSLSEDYGLVGQEDGTEVPSCTYNPQVSPHYVGGVSFYMAQTGTTEPAPQERYDNEEENNEEEEEINEEDDMQIFCKWDENTGQLQLDFPLLRRIGSLTSENTKNTTGATLLLPCHPVLTSVVVNQASEESGDDDPLLRMENKWALQVQSTTE